MDLNRQQMYEVVSWFLDESSSSEDEELNAVWMSLLESDAEQKPSASPKPKQCKPKEKRANRRDRKSSYPKRKDIDVNSYTEDEFKSLFRISKESYEWLTQTFADSPFRPKERRSGGKRAIPIKEYMLIFLFFAGIKSGSSKGKVRRYFQIADATLFKILHIVVNFLVDLSREVFQLPATTGEKEMAAGKFQKIDGFPNVIGCLGSTYIHVPKVRLEVRTAMHHHGLKPSFTVQAICDADCKFLALAVHEWRNFDQSQITSELATICDDGRYHVLANGTHEIRQHLLTPFGSDDATSKRYNDKFSATHAVTRKAFDLLLARFRQLRYIQFQDVKSLKKIIIACCVVHNVGIGDELDVGDEYQHDVVEEQLFDEAENADEEEEPGGADLLTAEADITPNLSRLGELKRDSICQSFGHIQI